MRKLLVCLACAVPCLAQDPGALLVEGRRAVAAGQTAAAEAPLREAAHHEKRYREALHLYRRAARMAPDLAEPHLELASLMERRGDWDRAIEHARLVINNHPADSVPLFKPDNQRLIEIFEFHPEGSAPLCFLHS